ncbi:hypothetical protein MT3436 [Mycobacterium tuberculosis CDC1551]|uniref:Uncharacterized protein n=1 Tax=Mycobacterium tuberculosis (strain CDC 1551 / Oshkosh) TaxID=83331 RepID=Q8VJ26_MYCTO|nr:hypothetical protein MT3436 [Mycobacterium tuberculosis CDC1551]
MRYKPRGAGSPRQSDRVAGATVNVDRVLTVRAWAL